jgi:dipeptidyl aminopeptidase/acylaminoacyl peptidase
MTQVFVRHVVALMLLMLLSIHAPATAEPRAMTPVDILSLNTLRNQDISPDGRALLYQVSNVDWENNKRISHIWRHDISSGVSLQMTFGNESETNPKWSPKGDKWLFVTKRKGDDHNQIYLMYNSGGEASRLAELPAAPRNVTWSDDGRYIYFLGIKAQTKAIKKQIKDKAIIPRFEDPMKQRQLWRVDIESKLVEPLTSDNYSVVSYSVFDNDNKVVYAKSPGTLIDNRHAADLWILDIKTGHERQITDNNYYEKEPTFSPDNTLIAYTSAVNSEGENYYSNNIFIMDIESQKVDVITKDFKGDVEQFAWSASGGELYFLANIGVSNHLFSYDRKQKNIKQLTEGEWTIRGWSYHAGNNVHLLNIRSATSPGDVWQLKGMDNKLNQLTDMHSDLVKAYALPKQDVIRWKSHDGVEIEGLLVYPLNYKKGQPFPLVTQTHGGPRSSDQYGLWSTGSYMPVLAAHGYGVLRVNHRGGVGYGDEFLRDMVGGYFKNAHLDVLSGIDYLVEKGLADPNKLVKMGWSAGGHMTNKLITVTDRFKAVSVGAGTVDWTSHYGETDTSYNRTDWFGGKPWQKGAPLAVYDDNSPLKDMWKVKTPTLIFVGEKDVRVPPAQSKMLFRALRDIGVDTELYIAPGEPHGYRKPTHRLFKINKELEWFEKYIHGRKYLHQTVP